MSQLCLNKKERNLLLNSKVTEDYPWLFKLLNDVDRITYDVVATLPEEQQNFFQTLKDLILKQAVSEWMCLENCPVEDMGENKRDWIPCSLCGQPNRWIFYIHNTLNGNRLNVGSECVKQFGINIEKTGMSMNQLIKNASRLYRLNLVNNKFPGISRILDGWDHFVSGLPIMISLDLEEKYQYLGERIRKIFNEYLDQKKDNSVFNELELLFKERERLLSEIDHYVGEKKHDKFIPNRTIIRWLENRKNRVALTMLKEDGRITWRTIHRIEEPNFMISLQPDLSRLLDKVGAAVQSTDTQRKGYVIEFSLVKGLKLFIKHNEFMLTYGGLLFGEDLGEVFNAGSIVKMGQVYDERSMYVLISNLREQVQGSGILLTDFDYEFNEILIQEENKYLITELKTFAETFKGLVFGFNEDTVDDLIRYVRELPNKRYSKKELDRLEIPTWRYRD